MKDFNLDDIVEITKRLKLYYGCELIFKYGRKETSIELRSGNQMLDVIREIHERNPRDLEKISSYKRAKK